MSLCRGIEGGWENTESPLGCRNTLRSSPDKQDGRGPNGLEVLHFPMEAIHDLVSTGDAHGGSDTLEEIGVLFRQLLS